MGGLFNFVKSTGLYFLGNVLSKLILFFLLPVYTHFLSPEDLGYYDVANTFLNLIITFLFVDIYVGVMRFIFDEKGHSLFRPITNGFVIFLGSLFLYTVVALLLYFFSDIKYLVYIYFYGVCLVLNNMFSYIARALKFNTLFAITGVLGTIVTCLISILGLVVLRQGVEFLYIAAITGLSVQIFVLESKVKVLSRLSISYIDKSLLKNLSRYSLPLSLNSLSYWLLTGYTSVAIAHLIGLEANGFFLIAVKFGIIITLFASCFNFAWQELIFEKGNDEKNELSSFYSKAMNILISMLLLGCVLIVCVTKIVFPIMVADTYAESFFIIPIYIVVAILSVLSGFLGQIYAALKTTTVLTYSTAVACLLNVILVPCFIKIWGLQGAVSAMLISYAVNVILRLLFLRNQVKIALDYSLVSLGIILIGASFCVYYMMGVLANLFFAMLVTLYFSVRYRLSVISFSKLVWEKVKKR